MTMPTKGPVTYAPEILALAAEWPVYESTMTDNEGRSWDVRRCGRCEAAILHESDQPSGVAYHLITHHGYRMDGRHEDEQQTAAEAAAERGEMNAYHRP